MTFCCGVHSFLGLIKVVLHELISEKKLQPTPQFDFPLQSSAQHNRPPSPFNPLNKVTADRWPPRPPRPSPWSSAACNRQIGPRGGPSLPLSLQVIIAIPSRHERDETSSHSLFSTGTGSAMGLPFEFRPLEWAAATAACTYGYSSYRQSRPYLILQTDFMC